MSNFHSLEVVGRASEAQLQVGEHLMGHTHAKIIQKSVILFWLLNMTIWCKHVHRLELQKLLIFLLRIYQLG